MMGFGNGFGMTGFGMGFGGLLVVALLVVGGVYLWRALERNGEHGAPTASKQEDSAHRVLRERYARGEIDHDEYQRRKAGLE